MKVTIDPYAGFCFGVERAIRTAEENIFGESMLDSLGTIVHNDEEIKRLAIKGLKTISYEYFMNLKHGRVLFRAHGEPPASYKIACRNGTKVIDATCPVVKKLQARVEKSYLEMKKKGGIVVIFGKKNHPEVIGLSGHSGNDSLVVSSPEELTNAQLPPVIRLYAQTTMGTGDFILIREQIENRLKELYPDHEIDFKAYNTICGQVSGREKRVQTFAGQHEVILFVGGKDSSNGKHLYSLCLSVNPKSYYISGREDILVKWFEGINDVGITGATSTPDWLMKEVGEAVQNI